jgi:hypothetical protein
MACCGTNTWTATQGSATVFINGKGAHRLGDQNRHCGGMGQLIEGSPNVIVGETTAGSAGAARLSDHGSGGAGLAGGRASGVDRDSTSFHEGASTRGSISPLHGGPAGDSARTGREVGMRSAAEDALDWLELRLTDSFHVPVSGVRYLVIAPDGSEHRGILGPDGAARVERIPPGQCRVSFPGLARSDQSKQGESR